MAYLTQTTKAKLAPAIKAVLSKYGLKGTISVRHHMTLVVTIRSGKLDLVNDFAAHVGKENMISEADIRQHGCFQVYRPIGPEYQQKLFSELVTAIKGDEWYDRSDIMSDYFDTAYYYEINVGEWQKPYRHV